MKIRNLVAALTLAAGTLGVATVGQAARIVEFDVGVAPPPERVEVVPAPRPGYVYAPGHYRWDGQQYAWHEREFLREREGHTYTPHVFERRGDTWHYRAGHWDDE